MNNQTDTQDTSLRDGVTRMLNALMSFGVPYVHSDHKDGWTGLARAIITADRLRAGQSEPVAKAEERIQISDIVEDAATVCERKDESGGERRQLEIAVRDALLAQLAASGSDEQRSTESTEPDRAPSGTRTAK